jgi:hypothetical protein
MGPGDLGGGVPSRCLAGPGAANGVPGRAPGWPRAVGLRRAARLDHGRG